MASLTEAAMLAQTVVGIAVLAMLAFAAFELHRFHRQQETGGSVEVMRQALTTEFLDAVQALYGMPDELAPEDIDADPRRHQAATTVGFHYEILGYLVYRRIVPLAMVDELAGGAGRMAWRKLRPWIEAMRRERGSDHAYEWMQWLAERLGARPDGKRAGAYEAHADWRE